MYGTVTLISLVLALAGLRYYEFGFHVCQVLPPPIAASWYPAIFFFIVPLSIVLAGTTLSTIAVLLEVRRREKAAMRFRSSRYLGDNQMHLTAKVFWKSVWYLSGFYLTYPIFFATFFVDITDKTIALFFLSSALNPSQGFWNFCVYAYTHRSSDRKRRSEFGSTDRLSSLVFRRRRSSLMVENNGRNRVLTSSVGEDSNSRNRVSTSTIEEVASPDDVGQQDMILAPDNIGEDLAGSSIANVVLEGGEQSIDKDGTSDLELAQQR